MKAGQVTCLAAVRWILVWCALAFAVPVGAQALYLPGFEHASFGDGLKISKYKTGYYRTYQDADNFDGVTYGRHVFQQADWRTTSEQLAYVNKRTRADGTVQNWMVGLNAMASGQSLWVAEGTYAQKINDKTTGEFTFNRDRVEVQPSLVTHVFANTFGLSLAHEVAAGVHVQWTGGETRYTDGNHRPLFKVKATYALLPEQGVTVQLRSRYFKNTDTTVSSGYFNPRRFVENMGVVEVNQTVSTWALSGSFGVGRQAGGDDPKTLAKAFEFSAATPVNRSIFVKTKAGYIRSLGYNNADFIYRYVSEEINLVF